MTQKKKFTEIDFEMFVMPWGTHVGKTLTEMPAGYLLWLCDEEYCPPIIRAFVEVNEEDLLNRSAEEQSEYEDQQDFANWK